jgi:hypothetical protein
MLAFIVTRDRLSATKAKYHLALIAREILFVIKTEGLLALFTSERIFAVARRPLAAILSVETIVTLHTGQPVRSFTVQRKFAGIFGLNKAGRLVVDNHSFSLIAGRLVAIFTVETVFALGTVGRFAAIATELLVTLVTAIRIFALQTGGIVTLFTAE